MKLVRKGTDFIEIGINIRQREYGSSTALAMHNWLKILKSIVSLWWDVRVVNRDQYSKSGHKLARIACPAYPSVHERSQRPLDKASVSG